MGSMNGPVKFPRILSKEEVDVIICRIAMIQNFEIEVPILDMPLSDIEVVETKRICGLLNNLIK